MMHMEDTLCSACSSSARRQDDVFTVPGMHVTDSFFVCPLDYDAPHGRSIEIFVRQCRRIDFSERAMSSAKHVLFYQGGPGFDCSSAVPSNSGMIKVLLDKGYTVNLLDQRGTGLSTALDTETLHMQGDLDAQVAYCKHFRADCIVKDSECIRKKLGISKWTILGQSYGGFCALTYLSLAPQSIEAVLIAGGMAPICHDQPDAVYHRLAKKLIRRNESYYEKFPKDVEAIRRIVAFLDKHHGELLTPNGGVLSSRRFRQIGMELGMHGGFDRMHNLVLKLDTDLHLTGRLTYRARAMVQDALHYDTNPIYSILHEAIYCQAYMASNWSSERVLATYEELNRGPHGDKPIFFYGENIFSWMFDDYSNLRPLKALAYRLAQEKWPSLYDLSRLNSNQVPLAASCYIMDMYVEIDLAIESLGHVSCSKDLVTNRWLHNGLRHAPEELLGYLFNLLEGGEP